MTLFISRNDLPVLDAKNPIHLITTLGAVSSGLSGYAPTYKVGMQFIAACTPAHYFLWSGSFSAIPPPSICHLDYIQGCQHGVSSVGTNACDGQLLGCVMKLGEEFDAAKFLRHSLELGAVILNTDLGVIYGVPTPVSDEMRNLLVWHNNDKGAVKKVARALSSNPHLKAAHEWLSTASPSFRSEDPGHAKVFENLPNRPTGEHHH